MLTNHDNLRRFANIGSLSRRQSRWAIQLAAYDFVISYRAGKTNPADAPSRRPDYATEKLGEEVSTLLPTL